MKITIELPDNTRCVSVTYIQGYFGNMYMGNGLFDSDEVKDGATLKIKTLADKEGVKE